MVIGVYYTYPVFYTHIYVLPVGVILYFYFFYLFLSVCVDAFRLTSFVSILTAYPDRKSLSSWYSIANRYPITGQDGTYVVSEYKLLVIASKQLDKYSNRKLVLIKILSYISIRKI